ncbi:MAG: hypothetical protein ACXADF_01980 [Candidatus Thorarchaeota archaeon]|jgi:hypothetical protein
MSISSSDGTPSDVGVEVEEERKSGDLIDALKASGHFICEYPNGLLSAVRLESIPRTRGVHVEVVHVLDLRTARFGKSGLAMRAALLESVNREYKTILQDVGLGDYIERRNLKTPFKMISLLVLQGIEGKGVSYVHPTRTVYVVTRDVKPTLDLSWLTDAGRVVTIKEFALARSSDARSLLPELKHAVSQNKWSLLERSIKRGWLGLLAIAAAIIGMASTAIILLSTSGSTLPSVLTIIISLLTGLWMLSSSKATLRRFETLLSEEDSILIGLGDSTRINKSIVENEDNLRLLGDISFVVSPLMATLSNAIEAGNLHDSVNVACSILDECVRLSPIKPKARNSPKSGDEGLSRFLDLFSSLGVNVEEEALALSYVALSAHITSPLTFEDMIRHVETLSFTLYNAGALRPDIKDVVDDKINNRAMKRAFDEFEKDLATEPEELLTDEGTEGDESDTAEAEDITSTEELDEDLLDDMLNSSIDSDSDSSPLLDEIPVIKAETVNESTPEEEIPTGADIVAASNAKQDSVEFVQASLLDSEEG